MNVIGVTVTLPQPLLNAIPPEFNRHSMTKNNEQLL